MTNDTVKFMPLATPQAAYPLTPAGSAPASAGGADFGKLLNSELETANSTTTSNTPASYEKLMAPYLAAGSSHYAGVGPAATAQTLPAAAQLSPMSPMVSLSQAAAMSGNPAMSGAAPSLDPISAGRLAAAQSGPVDPATFAAGFGPTASAASLAQPGAVAAPTPLPVALPEAPAAASLPPAVHHAKGNSHASYTVQAGDSLSKIARAMGGDAQHWHQLYALNKDAVGSNPNMIKPGLVLKVPGSWQTASVPTPKQTASIVAPKAVPVAAAPQPVAVAAAPVQAAPVRTPPEQIEAPVAAPPEEAPVAMIQRQAPVNTHEAEEEIERIYVTAPKPGSLVSAPPDASEVYQNNVSALQDAMKLVPTDSADYPHYKKTVDGYEAALDAAGRPAGAGMPEIPTSTPSPVAAGSAAPTAGGAALSTTDMYGPSPTAQTTPGGGPTGAGAPTPAPTPPAAPAPAPLAASPATISDEDMDAPPVGFY